MYAGAALGKQPESVAPAAEPPAKKAKKEEEDYTDVLQVKILLRQPSQDCHSCGKDRKAQTFMCR